ncbi:MAG: CHASE3 domain-containing protein [Deltaproteobacteria bacterium]|nr:CHASE3 domain-containing protein [Deltaproteobacteria bacterium]
MTEPNAPDISPSYRPKIAALVVIALMVAMMTGTARYFDGARAAAAGEVQASYDTSITLQLLLTAMVDSETGERGYLITRDPSYLEPYDQSHEALELTLGTLRDRFEAEDLSALDRDVAHAIQLLDDAIEHANADRFGEARALMAGNKVAMDRVREDVAALEVIERLRRRTAEQVRLESAERALLVNVIGSVVIVAFILLLAAGIRNDIVLIAAQNERLTAQGTELSQRKERLEALTRALAGQNEQLAETNTALAGANRERALAMTALERRNRDLDQFAYVTSHDLKAPLRAISNLAGWIEEDLGADAPKSVMEHVQLLKQRTERMNTLIEGILVYSRAGRSATTDSVSLSRIVDEVRGLLGVAPERVVHRGEDLLLRTDRTQITQVLQNLVSNALKHAGETPEPVEVSWRPSDPGFVEVRVRDHGPGIEPRFHDKIFEIFQTLNPRDKVESTGIGLAIVKKIVLGQGGNVRVESEPGQGATFVFTWPALSVPAPHSPDN